MAAAWPAVVVPQVALLPSGAAVKLWHVFCVLPCCRDLLQIHWPDRYVPLFGELYV